MFPATVGPVRCVGAVTGVLTKALVIALHEALSKACVWRL